VISCIFLSVSDAAHSRLVGWPACPLSSLCDPRSVVAILSLALGLYVCMYCRLHAECSNKWDPVTFLPNLSRLLKLFRYWKEKERIKQHIPPRVGHGSILLDPTLIQPLCRCTTLESCRICACCVTKDAT